MKIYLLIVLSVMKLFSETIEHVSIDGKPFTLVNHSYNEYGTKGEIIKFYKGEEENESAKLFIFIVQERSGACSAREREKGAYEINATNIIFYTSWTRDRGVYDAPIGARTTVYRVLENNNLKKVSSKIYIESTRKNYDEESGMQYLFKEPKTKEEKVALAEYVEEMEEKYKGKFVFGQEKQELIGNVRAALKRKMKSGWGH